MRRVYGPSNAMCVKHENVSCSFFGVALVMLQCMCRKLARYDARLFLWSVARYAAAAVAAAVATKSDRWKPVRRWCMCACLSGFVDFECFVCSVFAAAIALKRTVFGCDMRQLKNENILIIMYAQICGTLTYSHASAIYSLPYGVHYVYAKREHTFDMLRVQKPINRLYIECMRACDRFGNMKRAAVK